MKASPAFQFYPSDFLTGTLGMTLEQRGAYIVLLCWSWEHGPIPDDAAKIAQILGAGAKKSKSIFQTLRVKLQKTSSGLVNPRLEKVRKIQAQYRKKQSDNAKRRLSHGSAKPQPEGQPNPSQTHALRSPISDLRPSDRRDPMIHEDQDHRADARNAHKVLTRLAHDVLQSCNGADPSEQCEMLKDMAAKAQIPYNTDSCVKALESAAHVRRKTAR